MSMSCHLQWGHDQDLMCGVSKRERERESCHVSLMIDYIEKIIGTRAVFRGLSDETLGVFAVHSLS